MARQHGGTASGNAPAVPAVMATSSHSACTTVQQESTGCMQATATEASQLVSRCTAAAVETVIDGRHDKEPRLDAGAPHITGRQAAISTNKRRSLESWCRGAKASTLHTCTLLASPVYPSAQGPASPNPEHSQLSYGQQCWPSYRKHLHS